MNKHTVTVSQVLHPETNEVLAFEIVASDGNVYYAERPGGNLEGMRCNAFPSFGWRDGQLLVCPRVEIARLGSEGD